MRVLLIQGLGPKGKTRFFGRIEALHAVTPITHVTEAFPKQHPIGIRYGQADPTMPRVPVRDGRVPSTTWYFSTFLWTYFRKIGFDGGHEWDPGAGTTADAFAASLFDSARPDLVLVFLGRRKYEVEHRRLAREALLAEAEARGVKIETIR